MPFIIEGLVAGEHSIEDGSGAPHVHLFAIRNDCVQLVRVFFFGEGFGSAKGKSASMSGHFEELLMISECAFEVFRNVEVGHLELLVSRC